jgi:hypothetical protein
MLAQSCGRLIDFLDGENPAAQRARPAFSARRNGRPRIPAHPQPSYAFEPGTLAGFDISSNMVMSGSVDGNDFPTNIEMFGLSSSGCDSA